MKKALSLVLALAMMLTLLTACGGGTSSSSSTAGNDSSSTASDTTSTSASDSSSSSEANTPAEKAKITIMLPSFYGGELTKENSDKVLEKLEEFTNCEVTFQFEANDTYGDKFGLTLMDRNNMPMILTATGLITGTVIQAAQQGAFWDLTPYLSEYEYLSQIDPDVLSALTVNGQVVGIPKYREIGRYGFSYRTDWAEAVGITEEPKTIEDVYDMMYKFTYNDPDGNGKDDTYGMEMTQYTGPWNIIQSWFGVGNGWVEKDGELVPVHETEEYKEALEWMHKIYEEGLVRSDWASVPSSEWGNGTQSGQAGIFIDTLDGGRRNWDYFTNNNVASVVDDTQLAKMNLVGPINGKTLATDGYNGYFLITKDGAKTEEDLRTCLDFLDKMNSVEMRTLADFGIEGLTYTLDENGDVVMTTEIELANLPHQGLNQAVAYQPAVLDGVLKVAQKESQVAQADAYARSREVAVFNPAVSYLTNSETYANVATVINQTIDDARTQFICGSIDWAGFEAAVATWNSQGGEKVKAEVNEQYKANK